MLIETNPRYFPSSFFWRSHLEITLPILHPTDRDRRGRLWWWRCHPKGGGVQVTISHAMRREWRKEGWKEGGREGGSRWFWVFFKISPLIQISSRGKFNRFGYDKTAGIRMRNNIFGFFGYGCSYSKSVNIFSNSNINFLVNSIFLFFSFFFKKKQLYTV